MSLPTQGENSNAQGVNFASENAQGEKFASIDTQDENIESKNALGKGFPPKDAQSKKFFTTLEELLKESAKHIIFSITLFESISSDLKSMMEVTELEEILHIIGCKLKKQQQCYLTLKGIFGYLNMFIGPLKVEKFEKLSLETSKQIYFNLRIVCKEIKLQIARLNSLQSSIPKFLRHLVKSSFNNKAILPEFPFDGSTHTFIQELSDIYSLVFSVLTSLEGKVFSSLSTEQQVDVMITKLKGIRERFPKSAKKEMETRALTESMIAELQFFPTESQKVYKFFEYITKKIGKQWIFHSEMKLFFDEIESAMNVLEWEKIMHFSLEDQKMLYVHLLMARIGICFQTVRLNSIVSTCRKFYRGFDNLPFPPRTLVYGASITRSEIRFINLTTSLITKLTNYVTSANIILERLKENTRKNISSSEAVGKALVAQNESEDTDATIILEGPLENLMTNENNSSALAEDISKETGEPQTEKILNDDEKEVEMYENLIPELEDFYRCICDVMACANSARSN